MTFMKTRSGEFAIFAVAPGRKPRLTFSEELGALATRFVSQRTRLGDILEATKGRGFDLLLVFITLPFLTPIPLPGFSVPFGLVIFLIGMRLAVGRKPW